MKVAILGMDGYIGFPLAMYLSKQGHDVCGLDNFSRRERVQEVGSSSAIPIVDLATRMEKWDEKGYIPMKGYYHDLTDYDSTKQFIKKTEPEVIIHLAEQPSAPYSMISRNHAVDTITNNVVGTLNVLYAMKEYVPDAHLVKLGTMGEYGTPNIDIPEGFFEVEYRGRKDILPFPKQAGSYYHWSKVSDSQHVRFACNIWDLRSTDIMQGVVHGTKTDEMTHPYLRTRFDFCETFGTVINRYCAQAVIGYPLTPYGKGGQKRGFIALRDSLQCLEIAINNLPKEGEYRVFNQLSETYNVMELARQIESIGNDLDMSVTIQPIKENPRVESEEHYYNPDHTKLPALGFTPKYSLEYTLMETLTDLRYYRSTIEANRNAIRPRTKWK